VLSAACWEVKVWEAELKAVARFCPAVSTPWREEELDGFVERVERLENRADISVPMSWVEVVKVGSICCNEESCALAPLCSDVCCWMSDWTTSSRTLW